MDRSRYQKNSLPKRLQKAAKDLKENPNLVIRYADKSQCYVLLDTDEYKSKLDNILEDGNKFEKLDRGPNSRYQEENQFNHHIFEQS